MIFDVGGTCVRRLWRGAIAAGVKNLAWDGHSDSGAKVPSGRYFLRAKCGSVVVVRGLVLIE